MIGSIHRRDDIAPEVTDFGEMRWLVNGDRDAATALTLGEVTIRVGARNQLHRHDDAEEFLFLLEGRLEHRIGDDIVTLHPGDCIRIPRGTAHDARSTGDTDARMIVCYDRPDRGFTPLDRARPEPGSEG